MENKETVENGSQLNEQFDCLEWLIAEKKIPSALIELKKIKDCTSGDDCFKMVRKLALYCNERRWKHCELRATTKRQKYGWGFYKLNGNYYAVYVNNYSDSIELYDFETEKQLHGLKREGGRLRAVRFNPDGRMLYSERILDKKRESRVELWNLSTDECLLPKGAKICLSHDSFLFSPEGKFLLIGCNKQSTQLGDGDVYLRDVRNGKFLHDLRRNADDVKMMCFSPDGKQYVTWGISGLLVWSVDSKEIIYDLKIDNYGYNFHICSLCYSWDGKLVLSGMSNGMVCVWNIPQEHYIPGNQRSRNFIGHTKAVTSVAISPDGRLAISGCSCKEAKLWDVTTGECLHTFEHFNQLITNVKFSPDGFKMVIETLDKIYVYNLDFDLEFPGWHDWDEKALPYLEIFLILHPQWTDEDFNNILIPDLQYRGYGWLRLEGVRAKLEEMTAHVQKPTRTFWQRLFRG